MSTVVNIEYKNTVISTNVFYTGSQIICDPNTGEGLSVPPFEITFIMTREILRSIEKSRITNDDLIFTLKGDILYAEQITQNTFQSFKKESVMCEVRYSPREWLDVLRSIGYQESWILELKRPDIEGLDIVKKHLDDAYNRLLNNDPKGSMDALRDAWKSFNPLLISKWQDIATLIDEGSGEEPERPSKSKRVESMKNDIVNFTNLGPHGEIYQVFPEDAYLGYYQTVSMISYLSHFLKKLDI